MDEACMQCLEGATGETGHAALVFYVMGPYPGHNIFKCAQCDERWIRHPGADARYGWTRYRALYPIRKPRGVVLR